MLYITYVADLQLWLKFARVTSYADDTSTSVSAPTIEEVTKNVEDDAVKAIEEKVAELAIAEPETVEPEVTKVEEETKNEVVEEKPEVTADESSTLPTEEEKKSEE